MKKTIQFVENLAKIEEGKSFSIEELFKELNEKRKYNIEARGEGYMFGSYGMKTSDIKEKIESFMEHYKDAKIYVALQKTKEEIYEIHNRRISESGEGECPKVSSDN